MFATDPVSSGTVVAILVAATALLGVILSWVFNLFKMRSEQRRADSDQVNDHLLIYIKILESKLDVLTTKSDVIHDVVNSKHTAALEKIVELEKKLDALMPPKPPMEKPLAGG
jgi:hypothetical protein